MILDVKEILQMVADSVEFGGIENVSINARGIFQNTPAHVVISWRDPAALRVLIEHGADINAQGERGLTPLQHAIMMKNSDAIDMLLSSKADLYIKNDDGDDALSLARKISSPTILKKILNSIQPTR